MSKRGEGDHVTLSNVDMDPQSNRLTYMAAYTQEIMKAVDQRQNMRVKLEKDGVEEDVTPKTISTEVDPERTQLYRELHMQVRSFLLKKCTSATSVDSKRSTTSNLKSRSSARVMGGMKLSMDDLLAGIGSVRLLFDDHSTDDDEPLLPTRTTHKLPFIRVVLRKTECIALYTQRSLTVPRGTTEAKDIEYDNKLYDHLTIGKGKMRRQSDSEAQTNQVLYKNRSVNTTHKTFGERGTYVSYYEMFDTYQALHQRKDNKALQRMSRKHSSMVTSSDQLTLIGQGERFHAAAMVLERILAGNTHEPGQRRFRGMKTGPNEDTLILYRYTVRILFRYVQPVFEIFRKDKVRKAVSDISFCSSNGDIVAVAYGIYSFSAAVVCTTGNVCIWSIKNPQSPERSFTFPAPVMSVAFSPFIPSLIAVGMQDGSVEVRNITNSNDPPLAVSSRSGMRGCEPIVAIKWIRHSESGDTFEIDPFLCLSQNGSIMKYRIINSPYLLGFKQMVLERVEGMPEGLPVAMETNDVQMQANRNPHGLNFTMHPVHSDVYYLLTDEGCLHKCSTNYTHQYLEVWKTHEGSVTSMDFSPWSPKLFLTCGNDWCIRIWIESIFKPVITLRNRMAPVHCAYWSRTHSTIIVALNRKSLDIWDIRRNLLQPVSSSRLDSSFNTLFRFSLCGTCLAIGNERGNVLMCSLDDMPFPPHFQYDELEKAIFDAIATFPDLIIEVKSVGFFGYKGKAMVKPMY